MERVGGGLRGQTPGAGGQHEIPALRATEQASHPHAGGKGAGSQGRCVRKGAVPPAWECTSSTIPCGPKAELTVPAARARNASWDSDSGSSGSVGGVGSVPATLLLAGKRQLPMVGQRRTVATF